MNRSKCPAPGAGRTSSRTQAASIPVRVPRGANQSIGIERRSCKHIRKLRGDAAEETRIGSALPARPTIAEGEAQAPPLLLAESWDGALDPTGWLLSEKLDGVRRLLGRQTVSLATREPLPRSRVVHEGIAERPSRRRTLAWPQEVPTRGRASYAGKIRTTCGKRSPISSSMPQDCKRASKIDSNSSRCLGETTAYARPLEHQVCRGVDHLREELSRLEALGAEGMMLRRPGSRYESGRSTNASQGEELSRRRGPRPPTSGRRRPTQRPPRRLARRVGRRDEVRGGHRFFGRRAGEPARHWKSDHIPLSRTLRRRRAPISVVRRRARTRPFEAANAEHGHVHDAPAPRSRRQARGAIIDGPPPLRISRRKLSQVLGDP